MIKCAAIRFDEKLPDNSFKKRVVSGNSHGDILYMISAMDISRDTNTYEYGFLTDTRDFVDRKEAFQIASAAHQLKSGYENNNTLESYMLK